MARPALLTLGGFAIRPRYRAVCCSAALASATVLCSTAAIAAPGDTAQLQLQGSVPAKCAFTTLPQNGNLGSLQTGSVTITGDLGFTCNLPQGQAVSLTFQSKNGSLLRDGGAEIVGYQAAWNVQGRNDDFVDAANAKSAIPFTLTSSASEVRGSYKIKVIGASTALIAGNYRDIITYTITP